MTPQEQQYEADFYRTIIRMKAAGMWEPVKWKLNRMREIQIARLSNAKATDGVGETDFRVIVAKMEILETLLKWEQQADEFLSKYKENPQYEHAELLKNLQGGQ